MTQATAGQTVRIHYNARLENGTLLDSSIQRDPLEFVLGSGQVIRGLENVVEGMAVGEKKTVTILADEAYGERNEKLIVSVPSSELPEDLQPSVGMQLQSRTPDGQTVKLVVTEVKEDSITVDANHPLAGQALQYDIELVDIVQE
jgi:peptidylprolyl isomerase